MSTDAQKTLAGLGQMGNRLEDAMFDSVRNILDTVQEFAKANASTFAGDYPDKSTTLPGTLMNSIITSGPTGSLGIYEGWVGPTVVYGAQREWGGRIYAKPGNANGMSFWWRPDDEPRARWFHQVYVVNQRVYPEGRYLSPASRDVNNDFAEEIFESALTRAIEGG